MILHKSPMLKLRKTALIGAAEVLRKEVWDAS